MRFHSKAILIREKALLTRFRLEHIRFNSHEILLRLGKIYHDRHLQIKINFSFIFFQFDPNRALIYLSTVHLSLLEDIFTLFICPYRP